MASSSEIEKLERRCAENPHGLTFAPLAEAYRKHGDLDRAMEVLRAGRELHPDYIPASIVLGRCHVDRAELADAERAFAHVLTLDPENVIALKALADLAEREGRTVQAERWLNLLLAVDPSNDEARAQHDRIQAGEASVAEPLAAPEPELVPQARRAPEPEDAAEAEAELAPDPATDSEVAGGSEPAPVREPEPEPVSEPEPEPEPEPEFAAGGSPSGALDAVGEPVGSPAMELADEPSDALDPWERPMPAEPSAPAEADDAGGSAHADDPDEASGFDITVEREEEIVLTPADQSDYRGDVADALLDLPDEDSPVRPEPDSEWAEPTAAAGPEAPHDPWWAPDEAPAFAEDVPVPADPESSPDADVSGGDERYTDAAASTLEPMPDLMGELGGDAFDDEAAGFPGLTPEPAPVVTESMAELYLRQGHRGEALAIYRQLAERRPDDARIASLTADLAAELELGDTSQAPAFAAAETGGRSVAELLRGVLAGRLPAAPPAPDRFPENGAVPELRSPDEALADAEDQGEPTRPADDHLTLGAVFGDEGAGAPPAVPGGNPGTGDRQDDGGLSFDEFFGAPPAAESDATRTVPPPPSGDPDDLDQFHAWLQSLKR